MYTQSTLPYGKGTKRVIHPSVDSHTSEPATKKARTTTEADETGRKPFLRKMRAICDRYAVHAVSVDAQAVEGIELLRRFMRDELPKCYPLTPCTCHHAGDRLPPGVPMCASGGTPDTSKQRKANGFVMASAKNYLRKWLAKLVPEDVEVDDEDLVDSEDEGSGDEIGDDEEPSQVTIASSYNAGHYPSTPVAQRSGAHRKSTKGRLMVLYYLSAQASTRKSFLEAYRALCDVNTQLVHLCGCGLAGEGMASACVVGSHVKVATADLNRRHTHYHHVLRNATSKERYLKLLEGIRDSEGGEMNDVF